MKTWNDAMELITHLPESYLPGLLSVLVKCAYGKNVFQPGGASRLIQKIEADLPLNKKLNPKQANTCQYLMGCKSIGKRGCPGGCDYFPA